MPERRSLAPIVAAAAASMGAGACGWWLGSDPGSQAVLIARYNARVSLGLFLIVVLVWPKRRGWLAAFVTAHLLHLAAMIHLVGVHDLHLTPPAIALGLVAYAAPAVAWLIPGDRAALWRAAALAYVWVSFVVTYYGRLFEFPERRVAGVFAFVLLLAIAVARIARNYRAA